MLNRVQLIGNLGKDPEVKQFDNGKVCNFSLATSESYKNKNGEKVTNTEWHNIRIGIPSLVDIIEKYFKKGDPIYLEGKIKTREYEKDGNKYRVTEIHADKFSFLPKGKSEGTNTEASPSSSDDNLPPITQDDDLPF